MAQNKKSKSLQISGQVLDQQGQPWSDVIVQAYDNRRTEGNILGSAQTNAKGEYTISFDQYKKSPDQPKSDQLKVIIVALEDGDKLGEEIRKRSDKLKDISITINKPLAPSIAQVSSVIEIEEVEVVEEMIEEKAARTSEIGLEPIPESEVQIKKQVLGEVIGSLLEAKSILSQAQKLRYQNLREVLPENKRPIFQRLFEESTGDPATVFPQLREHHLFGDAEIDNLERVNKILDLVADHKPLLKAFENKSLYEIARNHNRGQLAELMLTTGTPDSRPDDVREDKAQAFAQTVHTKLFQLEPTAVIHRMIEDSAETLIPNLVIRDAMATFLGNKQQIDFNIKTDSIYTALKKENAFEGITPDIQNQVVSQLKTLQRVASLSTIPEAVPVLMKANLTSALQISDLPVQQFVKVVGKELGADSANIARQIHTNAVNNRIRNEQALIALKEAVQGTGVAFIDSALVEAIPTQMEGEEVERMAYPERAAFEETLQKHNLSWGLLFGDADLCECGECTSVYSAAAYFVDLLQYLRNNNLDPNAEGELAIELNDAKKISNTPLEKLFNRRPDLGCLELTCKNTNTILPYIDLVNEVMENYIVHSKPKAFNVEEDQTSGELLAQPQNTEYKAYCTLHKAVYPFTLPYHQPIDAARIYLEHLGTSRHELIKVFRSAAAVDTGCPDKDKDKDKSKTDSSKSAKKLNEWHKLVLMRAADAEYLGLTKEEYVILTKQGFLPKKPWKKLCGEGDKKKYSEAIGLKPTHKYYGYNSPEEMQDRNESSKTGLTFVKDQFLCRTGIEYTDLVELLKTQCLNPNLLQGEALNIMHSIQFSYQYLQTLVNPDIKHKKEKYKNLVAFLKENLPLFPQLEAKMNPDPCNEAKADFVIDLKELEQWVYCYFEQVGKIIVLESGIPCLNGYFVDGDAHLPIKIDNCQLIYTFEGRNENIGSIDKASGIITLERPEVFEGSLHDFISDNGKRGKVIKEGSKLFLLNIETGSPFSVSLDQTDSCDIKTVRLVHLDGSSLDEKEYDKIHRFIRLWRKLGWTIDEVDKAMIGLCPKNKNCGEAILVEARHDKEDCADESVDDCTDSDSKEGFREGMKKEPICDCEITPDLIHSLGVVKQLLDKTGLELSRLLAFWTNISTAGDKSLYKKLFLTHNLMHDNEVLKPDKNGNYLTQTEKITKHLPVLMAAFNLSADDLQAIVEDAKLEDKLSLPNLSTLYRYRLLSKVLGLRVPDFIHILPLFGNPFKNAQATLKFMTRWEKMEDAGFSHQQLNYIITDYDDPKKPLAPSKKTTLQLAKTLYDGINTIEEAHQDLKPDEEVSTETLRAKAVLLFDASVVEKIVGLIEGSNVFIVKDVPKNLNQVTKLLDSNSDDPAAPASDVVLTLRKKAKYFASTGVLQITGILTTAETAEFRSWSNVPKWIEALTRLEKYQNKLFKEVLSGVIETEKKSADREAEVKEAEAILKEGDISIPVEQLIDGQDDPNTAPKKRQAFLGVFLPYLRKQLTHRFVVDTLAAMVGLSREVTDVLISEILKDEDKGLPIYQVFEGVKAKTTPDNKWTGYLIPAAEAFYTFIIKDSVDHPQLSLDDKPVADFDQQVYPNDEEWWSPEPQKLEAGKLYKLDLVNLDLANIFWKTPTSAIAAIPPAQLLPDYASKQTLFPSALAALKKAAILVSTFNLGKDELRYLAENPADFGGLDFTYIRLRHWLRLEAYTRLRNSLPQAPINLLDFFKWAKQPDDPKNLSSKIAELTLWKKERIEKLIAAAHFNLNRPNAFLNEVNLLKLQKALQVADKVGTDIDLLFEWAKPGAKFEKCRDIAKGIEKAIRAQYKQEDWEQVVKPLNDRLRENQKSALIAYLLQHENLIKWGVTDADGLFEYFLIDVQMDACMETSRIKQALSSVQLFVQRCFLGLEAEQSNIAPDVLDRDRWEWMQRYRVWEANRKVFLYPENWIESNLRDDKSPFFKELESELLQKDINKQNVTDALKNYLYKVDEVANMEVVGLYIEDEIYDGKHVKKLHVFSRTRNAPYFFYYRYLDLLEGNWYPWEKVQVDIPSYDVEDANGQITGNGCYLVPVVWDGRLLIFFPQIIKKTKTSPLVDIPLKYIVNLSTKANKPIDYWEIKLAWSEYRNSKWTPKQLSKHSISHIQSTLDLENAANVVKDKVAIASQKESVAKTAEQNLRNAKINFEKASEDLKNPDLDFNLSIQFFSTALFDYILKSSVFANANTEKEDAEQKAKDAFSIADQVPIKPIPAINKYEFFPCLPDDSAKSVLGIKIYHPNNFTDAFEYNGHGITEKNNIFTSDNNISVDNFHYNSQSIIMSLQINGGNSHQFEGKGLSMYNGSNFFHPNSSNLLGLLNRNELNNFFNSNLNIGDFSDSFGAYNKIYHELKRPYSLYNWELFFHTPMMLADALSKAQQFEEAMKWYHFVFNPLASGEDAKRFWQFVPFRDVEAQRILDQIFQNLQPNQSDAAIHEWRSNPFMPHLVARSRPVAYMKWVVMKYIDNLITWGDYLYRQDTIESINQATQLYILAGHILGPKPQLIPKRGKIQPKTYLSLLDKWDAFSNAMTELEITAPFSNQISTPVGSSNGVVGFANVFGFASTLYFCIPNNPKLMGYWDTIADRLFKIRHCQNIEGVFRKLSLFEPSIDPGLLVNAAAQGLSIASVLNDLNTPMPNYRFYYLLQKALELCSELKSLGGALLSALEKKDNETIALIRARHENTMHNLVLEIKKQQLEEAQKSVEALEQNRKSPENRMKYYLQVIGEDLGKVPGQDGDFSEIANAVETPIEESGMKLNRFEKEEMDLSYATVGIQIASGTVKGLAAALAPIPDLKVYAAPIGTGVATEATGGQKLSKAVEIASDILNIGSTVTTFQSSNAGKKAGFTRALQDRIQQANSTGYEIKQIDKQITAQQIRINIANQEITNQQKQIDNALEVEEFLKNKYSNEELYTWMRGSLKTLYHQVYSLAYELAKKAEKVYRFERGLSNSNFIQAGYWDAGRDGLLAGEQLYVGLKQLEAAYQENRGHDYEITKHISLRQINPLAVLQLKETGKCEFALPEVLFDMDYPGHYKRRIKAVSLSIPCIAGPYTGLNGTLRLLENKFRNSAIAKDKTEYLEKTEESDERFSTYIIPITSIAASSAQNDSGMFELNFKDERYLPFEGAGAISKWRLELPTFRQFDYDSISDVVLQLRYTANEGGERLKKAAGDTVVEFIKQNEELGQQEGLFAIIDLKHDLPNQWHMAMQVKAGDNERKLEIPQVQSFLPFYVLRDKDGKPRAMDKILVTDVVLVTSVDLPATDLFIVKDGNEIGFNPAASVGTAKTFAIRDEDGIKVGDWALAIKNVDTAIDKAMLVLRFVLK